MHTAFATYRSQNFFCPNRCLKIKCKTNASDSVLIIAIIRSKANQFTGSESAVAKARFIASLGGVQTKKAKGTAIRFRSEEAAFIVKSTTAHLLQAHRMTERRYTNLSKRPAMIAQSRNGR